MSISSAMQTGVSGLNANSVAVGEISENIANANTTGYKRSFAQMVTMTPSGGLDAPSGVNAVVSSDVTNGGAVIPTSSATDFAVNGNGFFVVSGRANTSVESDYVLTRAGSFKPDENGDLVNSAGYFLSGYPYTDGTLGSIDGNSFNGLKTVNVTDATLSAKATTTVSVQGNLPSQETGNATPGAPFGLAMKLGDGEGPDSLGRHYTYHAEEDLRDQLAGAGFTPVDMRQGESAGLAGHPEPWIFLLSHA